MKVSAVFLVLAGLVAIANAFTCAILDTQTCAEVGASCIGNSTNDVDCRYGSYCTGGICTASVAAGGACTSDSQCYAGFECPTATRVCTALRVGPGEPCTTNAQCYTYTSTGRADSTCTGGKCAFIATGSACNSTTSGNCNGLTDYCNITDFTTITGTCISLRSSGQACDDNNYCGVGLACFNGKCVGVGSIASGQPCDPSRAYNCASGLICSNQASPTCQAAATGNPSGTACATDLDCGTKETCGCPTYSGQASTCVNIEPITDYNKADLAVFICSRGNYNCYVGNADCTACDNQYCSLFDELSDQEKQEATSFTCTDSPHQLSLIQKCDASTVFLAPIAVLLVVIACLF